MSDYLLLVTLGPVQDFIAQARRTRDLWHGSHLLSEISRAGAHHLAKNGAQLIFPAPIDPEEFEPCPGPLRVNGMPPQSIANRLLAEVSADPDPATLARSTREAVERYWHDVIAEPVRHNCAGLIAAGTDAVWEEQIGSFLEFTAAWVPLRDGYREARRAVERALAGRKALHDFRPWRESRPGSPRSSLDGMRETVLRRSDLRDSALVRTYRIQPGEQLDAIGLVKRAGGRPEQFVPIVNIALGCWLQSAGEHAPDELKLLAQACDQVQTQRVRRDIPVARPFKHDASLVLRSRWRPVLEESGWQGDPDAWGRRYVGPLLERMVEPFPYVACLVADGDRMGNTIDGLATAKAHRAFSRALAGFAGRARAIVEEDHLGSLVYAGGDDVLAFLPLPTALACAGALRTAFAETIGTSDLPNGQRPTLSVGIGVGHVMEAMGDLLDLGRQAEQLAKGGVAERNALGLVVDRRSGQTRSWRQSWDPDPVKRLEEDIKALDGRLPMGKVYEIDRTLRYLPLADEEDGAWTDVLQGEVRRCLARVDAGAAALKPGDVDLDLDHDNYGELHQEVSSWIARLLVARTFSAARPRKRAPRAVPA